MKKNIKASVPEGDVTSSFASFGLNEQLLQAVEQAGFTAPSPIQAQVIPLILQGKDVVGQAKTGTGKTAAFALPSLHFIDPQSRAIQLLVITPTRELATQVSEEIQKFGKPMGVKVVTVYGGSSYSRQIEGIKRGAQVVVATPGRLLDLLTSKRIGEVKPKLVVLDEADEMLDMGFLEDIQAIFEFLDADRQTLLFSATMPKPIQRLAQRILREPTFVSVESEGGGLTNQDIEQRMCLVSDYERDFAIARLIDSEQPHKSIIFCRTRGDVDRVNQTLMEKGYVSASLHGDIEQRQREKVIASFRDGRIQILVATDVAARGLNVVDVSHVFNYHLPTNAESYVHRIGRTGRAGRKGIAYSLLGPSEMQRVRNIKQVTGGTINIATIPSMKEVRKRRLTLLSEQISGADIHEDAQAIVQTLLAAGSAEEVTGKIVSMFLSRIEVTGPEKIGLPSDRLKEVLTGERAPRRDFDREPRRDDRRPGGGFKGKRPFNRRDDEKPSFRRDDERRPLVRSGEPSKIKPVTQRDTRDTRDTRDSVKPKAIIIPLKPKKPENEAKRAAKKKKNVKPWEKQQS